MKLFAYYFPALPLLLELGLEPALLVGVDFWQGDNTAVLNRCVSIYLGPLVISLHF